jgi:hypothetical protein
LTRTFAITQRTALGVIVAVTVAGALSAGCQNGVTGPSLSATFQQVSLQPTVAGLEGGANVCCCHLAGKFTNTSSISVDAELRFPAKDKNGQLIGQGEDLLTNVPSGATQSFLAVGIPAPCSSLTLSQILADGSIRLKGLFTPPN